MNRRQLSNILANFGGTGAGLIFPLLFNVIYYRLLGSEGYGLIGVYASLSMLAVLFDFGLTQTAIREVARYAANDDHVRELRSIVLTLVLVVCGIGFLLGLAIIACSKWLATSWLRLGQLAPTEVARAIVLIGGILVLLLPAGMCNAALRGLQRHVLSNTIGVVSLVGRGCATIAAMVLFGPTIFNFFAAQLAWSVVEFAVLGCVVWQLLPGSGFRFDFRFQFLKENWRYSSSIWLSSAVGQVTILGDKIILSAMLPLELFGIYSLIFTVVIALTRLATPFTSTYFPYFVELLSKGRAQLSSAFQLGAQLSSAAIIPAGLLMVIYAKPVMHLLTGDAASSQTVGPVFSILTAATTLSLLIWLPQSLQLAMGITSIALWLNVLQGILYLPLLPLLVPRFGLYAPVGLWLSITLLTLPIFVAVMSRLMPKGETWTWLRDGILRPGIAAAVALTPGALANPELPPVLLVLWLAGNYALAVAAAMLAAPLASAFIRERLAQMPGIQPQRRAD